MKRVAVIGAGAAGLATLGYMAMRPSVYIPIAYEQTGDIGGTWVYTDKTGYDENGLLIHTSMYKNLTTNLPKDIMAFSDFPFPEHLNTFPTHQEVYQYLRDYADHFNLRKYIKFNTIVTKVSPLVKANDDVQWVVEVRKSSNREYQKTVKEIFDAVCVCVGHFSVPHIPHIPGLDEFRGKILHSHDYRVPEAFKNMRTVVLGAGPSGQDISLEIADVAKEVILSHNGPRLNDNRSGKVRQTQGVVCVTGGKAVMKDGETVQMDAFLFCTGYKHSFPFLAPECLVTIKDNFVSPLYKHILHTEYPALSFIGVSTLMVPFPHFEIQIKFAFSALEETFALPSKEEMEADTQRDLDRRSSMGMKPSHIMGRLVAEYENELALLGKFDPMSEYYYKVFMVILDFLRDDYFIDYKTRWDVPRTTTGLIDIDKWASYPISFNQSK